MATGRTNNGPNPQLDQPPADIQTSGEIKGPRLSYRDFFDQVRSYVKQYVTSNPDLQQYITQSGMRNVNESLRRFFSHPTLLPMYRMLEADDNNLLRTYLKEIPQAGNFHWSPTTLIEKSVEDLIYGKHKTPQDSIDNLQKWYNFAIEYFYMKNGSLPDPTVINRYDNALQQELATKFGKVPPEEVPGLMADARDVTMGGYDQAQQQIASSRALVVPGFGQQKRKAEDDPEEGEEEQPQGGEEEEEGQLTLARRPEAVGRRTVRQRTEEHPGVDVPIGMQGVEPSPPSDDPTAPAQGLQTEAPVSEEAARVQATVQDQPGEGGTSLNEPLGAEAMEGIEHFREQIQATQSEIDQLTAKMEEIKQVVGQVGQSQTGAVDNINQTLQALQERIAQNISEAEERLRKQQLEWAQAESEHNLKVMENQTRYNQMISDAEANRQQRAIELEKVRGEIQSNARKDLSHHVQIMGQMKKDEMEATTRYKTEAAKHDREVTKQEIDAKLRHEEMLVAMDKERTIRQLEKEKTEKEFKDREAERAARHKTENSTHEQQLKLQSSQFNEAAKLREHELERLEKENQAREQREREHFKEVMMMQAQQREHEMNLAILNEQKLMKLQHEQRKDDALQVLLNEKIANVQKLMEEQIHKSQQLNQKFEHLERDPDDEESKARIKRFKKTLVQEEEPSTAGPRKKGVSRVPA